MFNDKEKYANAAPEAIAFERKQLETINAYIGKMTVESTHGRMTMGNYDIEELSYGTA